MFIFKKLKFFIGYEKDGGLISVLVSMYLLLFNLEYLEILKK